MTSKLPSTILLLAAFGLALSGCGGLPLPAGFVQAATATAAEDLDATRPLRAFETALEQIYTRVSPSVVMIIVDLPQGPPPDCVLPGLPFRPRYQGPLTQKQQSVGSGFVWDTQGHIVTNQHVIAGCKSMTVTFADGATAAAAPAGADAYSDLAVLRVDVPAEALHPIQLGDSTKVKVGQMAIAFGNPFGKQNTMSVGVISGVGRSLPTRAEISPTLAERLPDMIQTDAELNPGNSGGALVDAEGRLIGVTAAIDSPTGTSVGVGYAIPSALVRRVIPDLIRTGRYLHPWLGVSGISLTADLAQLMDLPDSQRGALVTEITPGGPAAAAGLISTDHQLSAGDEQADSGGDLIIAIDDRPVYDFDDVLIYLSQSTKVGQKVTLMVIRQGHPIRIDLVVAGGPTITSPGIP